MRRCCVSRYEKCSIQGHAVTLRNPVFANSIYLFNVAVTLTIINGRFPRLVFLNRRAAARYRALASSIPGRERFSWNM